jgi:hypothetical protein
MPIHDGHLRRTPFERLMPDPGFPDRHFDAIAAEAAERGLGLDDPGAFAMLESTGAAVEELRQPDAGAQATHTHAVLLFHAFHLQRARSRTPVGGPLAPGTGAHGLVTAGAARWAVETAMDPAGPTSAGHLRDGDARYWQLPQHLFWVRVDPDQSPTSLDGFFRTVVGDRVNILGVMNVFDGADGFEILPLPPAPLADLPTWATIEGRIGADTVDFESSMPGADLEGLYELRTVAELLKLVSRVERLAGAGRTLVAAGPPEADDTAADAGSRGPSPSELDYDRLVLAS